MKQQELADKIDINSQSLFKIERSLNFPAFNTLEKIKGVLGVTPNELLSGEWNYSDHVEPFIMDVMKWEEDFNESLDHIPNNGFSKTDEDWLFYMKIKLAEYICNYVADEMATMEELSEIKRLVQRQKLERGLKVHKELHSLDRYREQLQFYIYHNPYDEELLCALAYEQKERNIPNTLPHLDLDDTEFEE